MLIFRHKFKNYYFSKYYFCTENSDSCTTTIVHVRSTESAYSGIRGIVIGIAKFKLNEFNWKLKWVKNTTVICENIQWLGKNQRWKFKLKIVAYTKIECI